MGVTRDSAPHEPEDSWRAKPFRMLIPMLERPRVKRSAHKGWSGPQRRTE